MERRAMFTLWRLLLTALFGFCLLHCSHKKSTQPTASPVLLFKKDGTTNDNLGISVASAEDVDGDGRSDFIIGAFGASPGGAAYVYSGANGALLYAKNGIATGDELGVSVASAGDADGDGRPDFIIGAIYANPGGLSNAGAAYVYSGATGALLYEKNGDSATDFLGTSVASAGDVDGDGHSDFIIGASGTVQAESLYAGSAYIYSGATGALLYQKNGTALQDRLGSSVASAGDVDGDGRPDFITGAPAIDIQTPGTGTAYVYSGATGALLYQKNGTAVGDRLGQSVASAGDLNGDGHSDFIIGAYDANHGAGSAYVYSGINGTLLYQKNGAAGDGLGWSVASAGDVNGDGRSDFIVGAWFADPDGLSRAGSAYVYSGATGNLLCRINGTARGDLLGTSVASAGDVNGDGRSEFIIGAIGTSPDGILVAGSAYVFSIK